MPFLFLLQSQRIRRAEQVLPVVIGTNGNGDEVGKGWGSVNIVQILFDSLMAMIIMHNNNN
jgi:hypothetical protein